MPRLAIVGYANTGRTTVFNALTGLAQPTAPHPFVTTEVAIGVVNVPDPLLDEAARLEGSARTGYVHLELVDVPSHHGEALSAEVAGRLREMDALIVVLRAFESPAVPDDPSGIDPGVQADGLLLELATSDAEAIGRRLERARKEAETDPALGRVADALGKAHDHLQTGSALRSHDWSKEELAAFRDMAPLTLKPAIWVVNTGEGNDTDHAVAVRDVAPDGDAVVALSARLEEEAAQLEEADRAEMYAGLGLGEGALATVTGAAFDALTLVTFYTVNPNEAHAWAVPDGTTARVAAGKVHSDLERGFIRAEIVNVDELIAAGGYAATREAGSLRVEGQDYELRNGDVMLVRFSV